jgi:hypothetical protein
MAGWWCFERYEFSINEPPSHRVVEHWPAESELVRSEHRSTLLLFLHPKCPCSQASISELNQLLASLKESATQKPDLVVVATIPPTAIDDWWNTDTVASCQQIADARLFIDRGGREAARFGAVTSGTMMLFDEHGERRYAGGITMARGHAGANSGRDQLAAILRGDPPRGEDIPAFGCQLCLPKSNAHTDMTEQLRQDEAPTNSSI